MDTQKLKIILAFLKHCGVFRAILHIYDGALLKN